jgi:hypothetical protein
MNRNLKMLAALFLLTFVAEISSGQQTTSTWVGFISDGKCGLDGAHANHKACAIRCVTKQGESWTFVSSEYQVFKIQNQKAVSTSDLGHEVVVTGRIADDGSLQIEGIRPRQATRN